MCIRPVTLVHMGSALAMLAICSILLIPTEISGSQADAPAAKIYREHSNSVLLLSVKNENGEKIAQATGFVTKGGKVVTNEHVVRKGRVFIETGVALVPATTKITDAFNDLAILEPGIELAVAPLLISTKSPSPGDPVFTITNPAGLEKSISTGVVSNIREFNGHRLIQITAPISHGSSGGPVLNERGEVVGVAVGILNEGQNLNFAVPAERIVELLSGDPVTATNAYALLEEVESLKSDISNIDYSKDEGSDYQKTWARIRELLQKALESSAKNVPLLIRIAEMSQGYDAETGISAAEKAVALEPGFDTKFALGRTLVSSRYMADEAERSKLLERAELLFRDAAKLSKGPNAELSYALADVLDSRGSYTEAERNFAEALRLYSSSGDVDGQAKCHRRLARTYYAMGKAAAGKASFESLVKLDKATAWDWSSQAKRLEDVGQFHEAGLQFVQSAKVNEMWLWTNWSEAARMFWFNEEDYDSALYCARKCIEVGSAKDGSERTLAYCHRLIADILNKRGVNQEALSHARESVALNPEDPWAYDTQAEALIGLRRYIEATNASQQAIRLSDGKFYQMHFNLASAHYELENWELASQSYKKAAELETRDPACAYNVALCMIKLGYYRDAASWLEEVLRRDPNRPDRQDILNRIASLRRAA